MLSEIIILLLTFSCGVIATLTTLLKLFRVKCPNCQKKKPVSEIITLNGWEIKGQHCDQCQQKDQETIEIF